MTPRRLSALVVLPWALAACAGSPPEAATGVPDPPFLAAQRDAGEALAGVVMIVVDTLRADHLGCYGSSRGLTPRMDELAARSHLFEHAIATSSWTRPSVGSLLTSRFPTSLGLLDKPDRLPDDAVTLQEVLRDHGGFQTLAVITNGNISAGWGFDQGFDRFVWPHLMRLYPGDFPKQVAEGVTRKALELVDGRQAEVPFFLYVHYVDPHDPYLPHPELHPEPVPPGRFDGSRRELGQLDRLRQRGEEADYDRIRHLYAGEVRYVDHWIGRLLDGLAERGLGEELLIVLTSDHGEGLWTHGLRNHGNDLYEESVRVPLLVRYPGMTEAEASRVATPVSLVDVAPTVLTAAGAPKPPAFQGFDLAPLTRGESRGSGFEYVYTEMLHRNRNFEAIRHGHWKLIRNRGEPRGSQPPIEIYDLSDDPEESRSRLDDAPPRTRRPLAEALERWSLGLMAHRGSRRQIALSELDRETLDNLQALGYIGRSEAEAAARGVAGEAAAPAVEDLPEVALRKLDFVREAPEALRAQVEHGLAVPARRDGGAGLAGEASVLLRTGRRTTKWSIQAVVEEAAVPVTFTVQPSAGEPVPSTIHEAGTYQIQGPLPAGLGPTVRLRLECRHEPAAAAAGERPCISIRTLGVR